MPAARRGTLEHSLTLNVDLAPTILGAAGITPPSTVQGRDFSALYRDNKDGHEGEWRRDFYYEHPSDHIIGTVHPESTPEVSIPQTSALVTHGLKYVRYDHKDVEELYDLRIDPMELYNVYDNPVYTSRLKEL